MSTHSDRSASRPSFTESVPSVGNPGSDSSSLPNDSSYGTTSHGPYKGVEVENITRVLCEKEEGVLVRIQDKSYRHAETINTLTDNVLLVIFDFCRINHRQVGVFPALPAWDWHKLVHVCRRWRQIVFGSPRRLGLQILCTGRTPVRENLDIWPPFPIAIQYLSRTLIPYDKDNLFAALEHPGRICYVNLSLTGPQLREVAAVMQEPFTALTHLILRWEDERPPALSSGFLGGSAPCLRYMHLDGISFPELPSLLSSTNDLVHLHLDRIPQDGYISPEAMVVCLAALPRLQSFSIGFQMGISHADHIFPPPVTRLVTPTLLPALAYFEFLGDDEYLEGLVARINSPQLNRIDIKYWPRNRLFEFQVAQLFKFIDRSQDLAFTLISHANVTFSHHEVSFIICSKNRPDRAWVNAAVYCPLIEKQVLHIAQVFSQPSTMLSRVVHLRLSIDRDNKDRHGDEWLHLLCQLSAVRTLHVSGELAGHLALELEDVTGEMVAEVLPVIDLIYLDGQPVSSVEKFLAARRLSGRPVTIVGTETEFDEGVKFYASE